MFHPMTAPNHLDSSFYGFEVPVKHDMEYFKVRVLTDSTIVCFFAGESLFDTVSDVVESEVHQCQQNSDA